MKFVPSRDLRLKTAEVFEDLKKEGEIIVTSNGIPVSLVMPIDERNLEHTLFLIRSIKTKGAIRNMRETLIENELTNEDIVEEINAVREGK